MSNLREAPYIPAVSQIMISRSQHFSPLCFSINQIRIRDVIADDETTFEVHKLEHIKDINRDAVKNEAQAGDNKVSGIVMRLQCDSEENKNDWVKAINSEVKQLRNAAKTISSHQMFIL